MLGILSISLSGKNPSVKYSLKIKEDFSFEAYCCDLEQANLLSDQKITTSIILNLVLQRLEMRYLDMTKPENLSKIRIQRIVEELTSAFDDIRILLLAEQ